MPGRVLVGVWLCAGWELVWAADLHSTAAFVWFGGFWAEWAVAFGGVGVDGGCGPHRNDCWMIAMQPAAQLSWWLIRPGRGSAHGGGVCDDGGRRRVIAANRAQF